MQLTEKGTVPAPENTGIHSMSSDISKNKIKTDKKTNRAPRRAMSVRGKLLIYFACFAAVMLLIIWVFQVKMLEYFYRQTKMGEMSRMSEDIAASIYDGDLNSKAVDLALTYDTCIRVFSADSGHLVHEIVSADVAPDCLLHHFPSSELNNMYQLALQNGGSWTAQKITSLPDTESGTKRGREGGKTTIRSIQKGISAISVDIISINGNDYVIMLNTEFLPMTSTVRTLVTQFLWIAVAVLIAAAILALVFSEKIAKPISGMNRAAKRLAVGEYEPNFREEGYLETRELAATLNYAAGEIAKSDSLQRELIANVSHDLRTPLTMISGYAEVMRDIPGENSPENLQIIIDEAGRLSELVTDMLDLSKIRAGTKTPEMSFFDLTETIREVMLRYDKLISHDGYKISFVQECEAFVNADRTMMLQVVYNLINNAVNYTGEDKRVTVTQQICERDGERRVRISVADTGVGIPRDQIPLIWDRYYKIDKVHRRAAVGTGLGLSIVKGILRMHNAAYGVESCEGHGSVFWFELPLSENTDDPNME